jgi:hypothetical protein
MADGETRVITQPEGTAFDISHRGVVAVEGCERSDPIKHRVAGELVHSSTEERPLVHMVLWDEDCACEVNGRVTVVGDPEAPVQVAIRHGFHDEHRQSHIVKTALADPIHHALQLRTPLQVRFCNTWHLASDYTLDINLGSTRVMSLRLSGATVAIPRPCEDDDLCPPVVTRPVHP